MNLHKLLVIVHMEQGFGAIDYPENHNSGNLNGIALHIIDLQLDAVEVADPEGYLFPVGKRDRQPNAAVADGSLIGAEKGDYLRLVGLNHGKHGQQYRSGNFRDNPHGNPFRHKGIYSASH
ncbi:hypothetical protein D3C76_1490840 [compost metagenome]